MNKSNLDFNKQLCYCTCLHEMFEVNYRREKYNKRSAAPFMPLLVSRFLSFICISYPLRVFKFYIGILHDSSAMPLLKTLNRLPQSIAFKCLILFFMFACNNFPFRVFVTMIYWTSTEVLLSLVTPLLLLIVMVLTISASIPITKMW